MADIFGDEQQPEEALILTPGTEMKELTSLNVARLVDIQGLNAKAIAIRHTAEGMTIKGPVDEANASDFRKGVKVNMKLIDDERKAKTVPLDDLKMRIMDVYKPIMHDLQAAGELVGNKIVEYHQEQNRVREEALAKLEKRRNENERLNTARVADVFDFDKEGDTPTGPMEIVPPPVQIAKGQQSTTHIRKDLKFKVLDHTLVPPAFTIENEMKIRDHLRLVASQGKDITKAISGIEGYYVDIPVTR